MNSLASSVFGISIPVDGDEDSHLNCAATPMGFAQLPYLLESPHSEEGTVHAPDSCVRKKSLGLECSPDLQMPVVFHMNPSTAFYQAFHFNKLHESKTTGDRRVFQHDCNACSFPVLTLLKVAAYC
ncbi:hypothetical protein EK904_013910 [Melospiza melodia maxima]|nr:hypothetical protein EK904_013910 [Melospiza melodia maxima]